MNLARIRADPLAEQATLDDVVAALGVDQWQLATPSLGWSLADQVAHLTYFDSAVVVAITEPERSDTRWVGCGRHSIAPINRWTN